MNLCSTGTSCRQINIQTLPPFMGTPCAGTRLFCETQMTPQMLPTHCLARNCLSGQSRRMNLSSIGTPIGRCTLPIIVPTRLHPPTTLIYPSEENSSGELAVVWILSVFHRNTLRVDKHPGYRSAFRRNALCLIWL